LYDTVDVPFIKFITPYSTLIQKATQILGGEGGLPYKINFNDDKELEILKGESITDSIEDQLLKRTCVNISRIFG